VPNWKAPWIKSQISGIMRLFTFNKFPVKIDCEYRVEKPKSPIFAAPKG